MIVLLDGAVKVITGSSISSPSSIFILELIIDAEDCYKQEQK